MNLIHHNLCTEDVELLSNYLHIIPMFVVVEVIFYVTQMLVDQIFGICGKCLKNVFFLELD